jgi:ribonuclease T
MRKTERYFSVDVETSGPIPGEFSLLSIGACVVGSPGEEFSCLLKPSGTKADPQALAVTGLSLEQLERDGLPPEQAMQRFGAWVDQHSTGVLPVFVGLNAPFDWSFVNYYFHRYLGRNPFGFTALDIKALYMGVTGCLWQEARSSQMTQDLQPKHRGDHDALHDARAQAELFELIQARSRSQKALLPPR